jgi:hypothetical protein
MLPTCPKLFWADAAWRAWAHAIRNSQKLNPSPKQFDAAFTAKI